MHPAVLMHSALQSSNDLSSKDAKSFPASIATLPVLPLNLPPHPIKIKLVMLHDTPSKRRNFIIIILLNGFAFGTKYRHDI